MWKKKFKWHLLTVLLFGTIAVGSNWDCSNTAVICLAPHHAGKIQFKTF